MMYPFMTLEDETEIVHSDMQDDGRVKVYIEKPDENMVFDMPHAGFPSINGKIYINSRKRKFKNLKKLSDQPRI